MKSILISATGKCLTLEDLCIVKTASLLRDCYYHPDGADTKHINPFAYVPPVVINDLLAAVKLAVAREASALDTCLPLLTSGRLTDLDLSHVRLDDDEVTEILNAVDPHASKLTGLAIGPFLAYSEIQSRSTFTLTLVDFISRCTNLEYISIEADMKMLDMQKFLELPRLKALNMHCTSKTTLITSGMDGLLCNNLTHLKLEGDGCPWELIAKFLTCCPNLVWVDSDISGALEMLQRSNHSSGTLNAKYNLRKYVLGPRLFEGHAPLDVAIGIAADTCPMTIDLYLYFVIIDSFAGLARFKNIESLTIEQASQDVFGFDTGLTEALQCIGHRIKILDLRYVQIDFEIIGKNCPNLLVLKAIYTSSRGVGNSCSPAFTRLEEMRLQCMYRDHEKLENLQFLLKDCRSIKYLSLSNAQCLTDYALKQLLQKNSMSELKKIYIDICSLTERGIQMLRETCRRLEEIEMNTMAIKEDPNAKQSRRGTRLPPRRTRVAVLLNSYPICKRNNT